MARKGFLLPKGINPTSFLKSKAFSGGRKSRNSFSLNGMAMSFNSTTPNLSGLFGGRARSQRSKQKPPNIRKTIQSGVKFGRKAAPYVRTGVRVAVGGARIAGRIGGGIARRVGRKAAPAIGKIERKIVPTHTGIREIATEIKSEPQGKTVVYGRRNL